MAAIGDVATRLLEREAEIAALGARLGEAIAGNGTVLVLQGPAGCGKTALLDSLGGTAAADARVLEARGAELERDLPFGLVRQLLEAPLHALDGGARAALLSGPASSAGALLEAPSIPPPENPLAVAHGVYWTLARLADGEPLCLLVDDAQWADDESIAAFAYLARRIEGHRILLALGTRSDEPSGADWRSVAEAGDATLLEPAPLSLSAARRLLRVGLGADVDEGFARACEHATGGNPWLLRELIASCRERGLAPDGTGAEQIARLAPAGVAGIVLARIAAIGADAVALARALAILERGRLADAARLAELDDGPGAQAADALIAAGVLARGLPLEFVHPIARATVEAELSPATRDRLHRRAAAVLAASQPATAALHLLRCESAADAWAVDALCAAADEALARAAPGTAVQLLERALAEGGDATVRERLGRALLAAGDPRATGELLAALDAAVDPAERLRLAGIAGQAQFVAGEVPAGIATVRAALAQAERAGADAARHELLAVYATMAYSDVDVRADVVRRAGGANSVPQLRAVAAIDGFFAGRPADEVVPEARRAIAELELRSGIDVASTFHLAVYALAGCDHVEDANAALERVFELARDSGSRFTYGLACFFRMWCRWCAGDLPGVVADGEETIAFSAEGGGFVIPNVRWLEAEHALLSGDLERCEQALDDGMVAAHRVGWSTLGTWLLHGRAGLRLRRGDYGGALADAVESGELLAANGAPSPAILDWRGRGVRAALGLGERERARELAADGLARAETVGAPRTLALARRSYALTREGDERLAALRDAADIAARGPNPLVRAEILFELGVALKRARHRREAREPLRQAIDLARRCGAPGLAADARVELEATGARRRSEPAWGVDALTARERDLARLAAAGLSNTEIAERLFITRKTVESHLSAVFRKLEIASREELPAALAGGG